MYFVTVVKVRSVKEHGLKGEFLSMLSSRFFGGLGYVACAPPLRLADLVTALHSSWRWHNYSGCLMKFLAKTVADAIPSRFRGLCMKFRLDWKLVNEGVHIVSQLGARCVSSVL